MSSVRPIRWMWMLYLLFRGLCGMLYGYVHEQFYNGGDALMFFKASTLLKNALANDFVTGWQIFFYPLFAQETAVRVFFDVYEMQPPIELIRHLNNFTLIQLLVPLNVLSGGSFYLTNFFCGLIAGGSAWGTFRYFDRVYPNQTRFWALIFLFLPVTCFWASGISKETLVFALMCGSLIGFHRLINARNLKEIRLKYVIGWGIALFLIGCVRIYLAAGWGTMFVLWLVADRLYRHDLKAEGKKHSYRWVMRLVCIGLGTVGVLFFILSQTKSLHPSYIWAEIHYNREEPMTRPLPKDRPRTHFKLVEDTTLWATVKAIPSATSAVFFRPFPHELWEKNTQPITYTASADGLFTLALCLFGLYYRRKNNPHLLPEDIFFLFFALIYGTFLGLSVGNWGTLFRYKVYVVPFLFVLGGIYRKKEVSAVSTNYR